MFYYHQIHAHKKMHIILVKPEGICLIPFFIQDLNEDDILVANIYFIVHAALLLITKLTWVNVEISKSYFACMTVGFLVFHATQTKIRQHLYALKSIIKLAMNVCAIISLHIYVFLCGCVDVHR